MTSSARQPRCLVIAGNGVQLAPIECNVHVSIHQNADTFYATLPLDNVGGLDEIFWANATPISIEIRGTNDKATGGYRQLLIGNVDETQINFNDRTVAIKGRDYTARLLDYKVAQQWRNRNVDDVIKEVAGAVGLDVQFVGDEVRAGTQYDQDFTHVADLTSGWNVIVDLARKVGCIAFVKSTTVYVQPIDAMPLGTVPFRYARPTPLQRAQSTAPMISAMRNLNLAKDASVTIKSYQHKQGKRVVSTFDSKGKQTSATSDRLVFEHRAANLTKGQQDKIAKAHLKATISHERVVNITNAPGDVNAVAGLMGMTLTGTGTAFDQTYILSEVVHRFSREGGYGMDLTAHNADAKRGEPTQVA